MFRKEIFNLLESMYLCLFFLVCCGTEKKSDQLQSRSLVSRRARFKDSLS